MKLMSNETTGVVFSMNSDDVAKIFSGQKKIDIRKNFPKLKMNYKGYIYCTNKGDNDTVSKGFVVGEFRVSSVKRITSMKGIETFSKLSGESIDYILSYANGKTLYGLELSDIVRYKDVKAISDFCHPCNEVCMDSSVLTRPPQSWTYVKVI